MAPEILPLPQWITVIYNIKAECETGPKGSGIKQIVWFSIVRTVSSDWSIAEIRQLGEYEAADAKPDCTILSVEIGAPLMFHYGEAL